MANDVHHHPADGFRIGELAAQTGVSVSAIRFYESKGLLEPESRTAGQRRYSPAAVERLRLVVTLRGAGLTVADVLAALDRDPGRSDARRQHAADRLVDLRQQLLTTLSALVVVEHASRCRRDPDDDRCVVELEEQCAEAAVRVEQLCADLLPAGPRA